jgi:hypothetical protein
LEDVELIRPDEWVGETRRKIIVDPLVLVVIMEERDGESLELRA